MEYVNHVMEQAERALGIWQMTLLELNNTLSLTNLHPIAREEMEKVRDRMIEELRIAALPWHERAMMDELEKTSNRIFTPYD